MKPRARRERALLRNRRRGIQPHALLAADPCTAMVGIRKLHPAERLIMRRALNRELWRRFFPEYEWEVTGPLPR